MEHGSVHPGGQTCHWHIFARTYRLRPHRTPRRVQQHKPRTISHAVHPEAIRHGIGIKADARDRIVTQPRADGAISCRVAVDRAFRITFVLHQGHLVALGQSLQIGSPHRQHAIGWREPW